MAQSAARMPVFSSPRRTISAGKEYLVLRAIPIVTEAAWNEEGRSFCFRDPDNNLLEIANADFWPR